MPLLAHSPPCPSCKSSEQTALFALLLSNVGAVLFVFVANVFENVGTGEKLTGELDGKEFGVHLRIVECHFNIHVSEVAAAVTLHQAQSFAMGVADCIEPCSIVEARRFHDERVALPFAHRVPKPGRLCHFLGELASIRVDLAMRTVDFEQDNDQPCGVG
jgi:hypothetical protein